MYYVHVCMYVCMYISMHVCGICMMYMCVHVCMYMCTYVCVKYSDIRLLFWYLNVFFGIRLSNTYACKTCIIEWKLNSDREVSCILLLVFYRLVYQRMNNKNIEVAAIYIYCNYLQQK